MKANVRNRSLAVLVGALLAGPLMMLGAASASAVDGAAAATETPGATAKKKMFVVAHRGDVKSAPETTLEAFTAAIDKGVDGIEFDVRYTKDGVAVALHDDTLDRTTNCKGLVAELTFTALQQCELKDVLAQLTMGNRVPTVEQCLAHIGKKSKSVKAFMHQKTSITAAQASALTKLASKTGMGARSIYVVERTPQYDLLRGAGVTKDQLGLMVHLAKDYTRPYKWLVPYATDVTHDVVLPAVKAGKIVLPVESAPAELATTVAAGANGVYLNDLDEGLAYLKARGLH